MIDEVVSAGVRQFKACEVLRLSVRTIQNWRKRPGQGDLRRGPKSAPAHKLTDKARAIALAELNKPENAALCPGQLVAKLADEGKYLMSESSMYRMMRQEKLLKHRRPSAIPQDRPRPEAKATRPNQLWAWDITYLPCEVKGHFVSLYTCLDVFSRKIVGWCVEESETGEIASSFMEKTILAERAEGSYLCLHSDNGAPMTSSTLKSTLDRLGVTKSLSRPGVSDDNAFAESLFRTLKYRPNYPFRATFSLWREWVQNFVYWYNEQHRHSGISYVTPVQRHMGEDFELLAKRKEVYETARKLNPRRWTSSTRKWEREQTVRLAPLRAA